MFRMMMTDPARDRRSFAPADAAAGAGGDPPAGGDDAAAAAAAAAAANPPAGGGAKWWEASTYSTEERDWLAARGLTEDDPLAAIPKMVKGHRAAELRIGKGLDTILDKPAKDQPYSDWVAKNREALGLPADEKGYEIARPQAWPKDAPWDEKGEAAAKAIAVKYGVPKEALQDLINLQAQTAMQTYQDVAALGETAKRALMADLERDFGDQTPKVIHQARLGAQFIGEKAGLDQEAIANLSDVLTAKTGDANAIRAFRVIGEMLGDDTALGIGQGGGLTTTPAEARAEIARLRSPAGDYGKAVAAGDRAEIARLQPTIDRLTKIAAG